MFPLNHSKAGEEVTVECIDCDCDDVCRLNELGPAFAFTRVYSIACVRFVLVDE